MNVHSATSRISGTLLLLLATPGQAADTLALWTFETTIPLTAGPHAAEVGTGAARGFHADAAAAYSDPVGNGSAESFSSTRWAIGDYYEFRLATIGYQDLVLSWDQSRSGTGPATFDLAYSTNGTDFTVALPRYAVSTGTFVSGSVKPEVNISADLGRLAPLNNAVEVWFRLIAAAASTATAGASRVDNFSVTGNTYIAPAVPLHWALPGGGAWNHTATNWTADAAGTGPLLSYPASHAAIFSSMGAGPKIIQIGAAGVTSEGGVRFESTGFVLQGGSLTLEGRNGRVWVTRPSDFATIDAVIKGNTGLWKGGDGTLTLSRANQFTGTISVNGGTLSVASSSALGSASNALFLNGGTLQATASVDLGPRELTGKGTLSVAAGARLSTSGDADFQDLSVAGGEVELLGTVARARALTFLEPTTLRTASGLRIGVGGITTQQVSGTARLLEGVDLEGATRSVVVADGSSDIDLTISGIYRSSIGTGRYKLQKLGPGTLDLQAGGTGSIGLRIGTSESTTAPVNGGRVLISSAAALGGSTLELNYGTLEIAAPPGDPIPNLTGSARALIDVTLGGSTSGGAAVIQGGDIEFLGDFRLLKPSGETIRHTLELRNHTILSGALRQTSNPATGTFTGLRLLGPGKLSLRSTSNDFTDKLVVDGPTVELSGTLAAARVEILRGTLSGITDEGSIGYYGEVILGDGLPGEAFLSPGSSDPTRSSTPAARFGTLMLRSLSLLSDAVIRLDLNSDLRLNYRVSLLEGGLTIAKGAELMIVDLGSAVLPLGFELTIVDLPFELAPTGSFDQQVLATGTNVFQIFYTGGDGNDIALRVIPEPAGLSFAGAILLLSTIRFRLQTRHKTELAAEETLRQRSFL